MARLILLFTLSFLMACSSGQCRQKKEPRSFADQFSDLPQFQTKKAEKISDQDLQIVEVFKSDGSKQCESGSAVPIEVFKEELERNRIKILKISHRSDGMIRPQVCGAATGMIYVFEIQKLDLKKANDLGFKALVK